MQKAAYASAAYLSYQLKQNHQKRTEYYFGFQAIYGGILKLAFLLALAKLLGCIATTIIVALTFSTFRFYAGGVHMGTYTQCAFITIFFFLAAAITAQVLVASKLALFIFLIATTVFALACIILYAPKDSPMNAMSENSKKKLKNLSILCLFFWIIISIIFIYNGYYKGITAICLALILETSTFMPVTANMYDKFNLLLNAKRRKA